MTPRPSNGIRYLCQYPTRELYRLIVDGKFHQTQNGWVGYERREPGSLKAFFAALSLVLHKLQRNLTSANKENDLTIDFIEELHAACLTNVANTNNSDLALKPGQMRCNNSQHIAGFQIEPNRVTLEGVTQMLNLIESQKVDYPLYQGSWLGISEEKGTIAMETAIHAFSIENIRKQNGVNDNKALAEEIFYDVKMGRYAYCAPRADYVAREMRAITANYNQSIAKAMTDDEKLTVIVDHIQQYERLHPFMDGNGRTFVNLLLNYLLMKNGFPPATFYEPNLFDVYSVDDLVTVIKNGIAVTQDVLNGNKSIFDFDSTSCDGVVYQDIVKDFVNERSKILSNANQTGNTHEIASTNLGENKIVEMSQNKPLLTDRIAEDFIHQVLEEAKKTFIPHRKNIVNIATPIPNTNFITAAAPKNGIELNNFIFETMTDANSPRQIVVFGKTLGYDSTFQDFHDYCLQARIIEDDAFHVEVKRVSGYVEKNKWGYQVFGKGLVHSQLQISNKMTNDSQLFEVTFFESAHDAYYINLKNDTRKEDCCDLSLINGYLFSPANKEFTGVKGDETDELYKQLLPKLIADRKENMWQLYKKSQKEPILVHSVTGVGIAGHFILTMEILKNYDRIFGENDAKTSADHIHKILINMRSVIPSLVITEDQFTMAIYNAHEIHEYALEKQYISVKHTESDVTKQLPIKTNDSRLTKFSHFALSIANTEDNSYTQKNTNNKPTV